MTKPSFASQNGGAQVYEKPYKRPYEKKPSLSFASKYSPSSFSV